MTTQKTSLGPGTDDNDEEDEGAHDEAGSEAHVSRVTNGIDATESDYLEEHEVTKVCIPDTHNGDKGEPVAKRGGTKRGTPIISKTTSSTATSEKLSEHEFDVGVC